MRKLLILFFVTVFVGGIFAAEFNQFRPEGEISSNEVTFWGEVVSEETGELKLYVNNEIVHTGQHNGGRTDFPAGYTQEFSNGDYNWSIELEGETVERSDKVSFSIERQAFLEFEHRENRTFDVASSPGELKLFVNKTEVVTKNLRSSYTDTLNLTLSGGTYTYYATLDTNDEILKTENRTVTLSDKGFTEQDINQIGSEFEEQIEDSISEPQNDRPDDSVGLIEENAVVIVLAALILILVLALIKRPKTFRLDIREKVT